MQINLKLIMQTNVISYLISVLIFEVSYTQLL